MGGKPAVNPDIKPSNQGSRPNTLYSHVIPSTGIEPKIVERGGRKREIERERGRGEFFNATPPLVYLDKLCP